MGCLADRGVVLWEGFDGDIGFAGGRLVRLPRWWVRVGMGYLMGWCIRRGFGVERGRCHRTAVSITGLTEGQSYFCSSIIII